MAPSPLWTSLLFAGVLAACEPTQWLVFVTTDARVPQFGDRLLVEVLRDDGSLACAGCQRQISVGTVDRWPVSFGVSPVLQVETAALHVRARLYRSDHVDENGLPSPAAYLDRIGRLPPVSALSRVGLMLGMECFGVPSQLADATHVTCQPTTGLIQPEEELPSVDREEDLPQTDSWRPGLIRPCQGAPADMQCIPGGAFVLGGLVDFAGTAAQDAIKQVQPGDARPEHLVVLHPFAMDTDELTVSKYHALRALHPSLPLPGLKGFDSKKNQGPLCHYTDSPADEGNELPLNCISPQDAAAICVAQGKRLVTEAEWEYVAGNGVLETRYPWGDDEDACSYTIIGRGRLADDPPAEIVGVAFGDTTCRLSADNRLLPWGPQPGGHPRDVGRFGVHNLGGNLYEWLADDWAPYTDPCWNPTQPGRHWLESPLCRLPADRRTDRSILHGGVWNGLQLLSAVIERNPISSVRDSSFSFLSGVRCAKDL